jgi:hypothetical protein
MLSERIVHAVEAASPDLERLMYFSAFTARELCQRVVDQLNIIGSIALEVKTLEDELKESGGIAACMRLNALLRTDRDRLNLLCIELATKRDFLEHDNDRLKAAIRNSAADTERMSITQLEAEVQRLNDLLDIAYKI